MTESFDPFVRTDLTEATPNRLDASHVQSHLEDPTLQSRSHSPDLASLVGYLGSALRDAGKRSPGDPSYTVLAETEAVNAVLAALRERFPLWFGSGEHLSSFDEPVGDDHLSAAALREWYFQHDVVVEDVEIDVSDAQSRARVIAPILARLDERLADQREADAGAATRAGQRRVKHEVIRAVVDEDLSAADVDAAVAEAKEELMKADVSL